MEEFYRYPYKIRKAANYGKEVTVAPEAKLEIGDEVTQICDGFILVVPKGTRVNEEAIRKAIQLPKVNRKK